MVTARRRPLGGRPETNGRRWGDRLADESGSSPVTAVGGVLMFLAFLLVTVQTTVHLFASTRAGAVALEAAGRGARTDATDRCGVAEAWADQQLAGWDGMDTTCRRVGSTIEVRVAGRSPAIALAVFGAATGLDTLAHRAAVRVEEFR